MTVVVVVFCGSILCEKLCEFYVFMTVSVTEINRRRQ